MSTIVLGDGPLGRAIGAALEAEAMPSEVLGRPAERPPRPAALAAADLVVDASRARAVAGNVRAALDAGCRRFVIATTGWDSDPRVRWRGPPIRRSGRGRRAEPQPRRRALPSPRRAGRRPRRGDGRFRARPSSSGTAGPRPTARPARPGSWSGASMPFLPDRRGRGRRRPGGHDARPSHGRRSMPPARRSSCG